MGSGQSLTLRPVVVPSPSTDLDNCGSLKIRSYPRVVGYYPTLAAPFSTALASEVMLPSLARYTLTFLPL